MVLRPSLAGESRALRTLSVFAGSWTVQAARRICTDRTSDNDVLALLADLVDRSMIVADVGQQATRYRMLSTLRDFAADRLPDDAATAELTGDTRGITVIAPPRPNPASARRRSALGRGDHRRSRQPPAAHRWALDRGDIDLDAPEGCSAEGLWNCAASSACGPNAFRWVENPL